MRETGNVPPVRGILSISLFGKPVSNRAFTRSLCSALVVVVAATAAPRGASAADERALVMHNIHTQEDINIVYKRDGEFVPDAVEKLNHFMRDWRRNITIKIDPKLYDIMWQTHQELGSKKPINLICGHRSSATNEGLRRTRGGQARGSLHITGQAADIQFPDIQIKQLRNSALIMERGGVGYYPSSSIPFVHVDTGQVRHWPRMQRQELAILFPSGHSKHVPADRRPLTKNDFRVALAALQEKGGELPLALQRRMRTGAPSTVLASLSANQGGGNAAGNTQTAAAPLPTPKPKAPVVLASLTPSFDRSDARPQAQMAAPAPVAQPKLIQAVAKPSTVAEERTIMQPRMQLTSAKPDAEMFTRDIMNGPALRTPVQEVAPAEPDEDELSDDLEYQPYPVLPYMSDTPLAQMDFTGGSPDVPLSLVHNLFGETREMLVTPFQSGLQVANLYWAQRFKGTAVNTSLKRVARGNTPSSPVKTAQSGR